MRPIKVVSLLLSYNCIFKDEDIQIGQLCRKHASSLASCFSQLGNSTILDYLFQIQLSDKMYGLSLNHNNSRYGYFRLLIDNLCPTEF